MTGKRIVLADDHALARERRYARDHQMR